MFHCNSAISSMIAIQAKSFKLKYLIIFSFFVFSNFTTKRRLALFSYASKLLDFGAFRNKIFVNRIKKIKIFFVNLNYLTFIFLNEFKNTYIYIFCKNIIFNKHPYFFSIPFNKFFAIDLKKYRCMWLHDTYPKR